MNSFKVFDIYNQLDCIQKFFYILFSVGENAHVLVGLKQKIAGIEMAVTNCTVFDDEFSQSYSVIDYPRCADSIVNAEIRVGSDQESFQFAQRLKN